MYKSRIRNAKGRQAKDREVTFPEDGQEFAVVERMMGNGRIEVFCQDGANRIMRIRGAMRKFKAKVIIEPGDLVIIARWDFEDDKGDVLHKYRHEELTQFIYRNELPEKIHKKITKSSRGEEDEGYVVFADEHRREFLDDKNDQKRDDDDLNIDEI